MREIRHLHVEAFAGRMSGHQTLHRRISHALVSSTRVQPAKPRRALFGVAVRPIDAKPKTIGALLHNGRFAIDDYQREYKWTTKQVEELLNDLAGRFDEEWNPGDERKAVQGYGGYFLGSIVLSHREGRSLIVDGQQRITTLTLLLMYLHRRTQGDPSFRKLDDLIYSWDYGNRAFNLDVDERTPAMESLFRGEFLDDTTATESVRNIIGRFADIERLFAELIVDSALPWFVDWLVEKVMLVEITAFSDDDAYTIFETMNDRGLSLTPLEMLKGWLLANIKDEAKRAQAGRLWMDRVATLQGLGKDEDTDAVKAWLRSQYAKSIRDRKKNASPMDFDRLGTEFHRWLRENEDEIGLVDDDAFFQFVHRDLAFYTRWYERLRKAATTLTPNLEPVHYLGRYGFTLQYPLLLAPLRTDDPDTVALTKVRLVADYLDILLARRLWNFRLIAYSTMQYAMFVVMRDIRRMPIPELSVYLRKKLDEDRENTFAGSPNLRVHQQNRFYIHQLLARMTDHVERQSGLPGRFAEYVGGTRTARYEVEHVWANHPERHTDEFPQAKDFDEYRNRIGGLLLLPKAFNASYGDLPYVEKVDHYLRDNLLAQSLHPGAYTRNPGFVAYIKQSGLKFRPMAQFRKAELDERQELYRGIAEELWSTSRLDVSP
jgi:hypothetical protein